MTRDEIASVREVVERLVAAEGLHPFARRTGLAVGVVRSLLQERDLSVLNFSDVCDAVGYRVGLSSKMAPELPMEPSKVEGETDLFTVPQVDVRVSAGGGLRVEDEREDGGIAFPRAWLLCHGVRPDAAKLVRVAGDSMAPTIPNGSTVLVDTDRQKVDQRAIYCFSRSGTVFIKRLLPGDKGLDGHPSAIVVTSDNAAYPPELITGGALNDIRVVGRVRVLVAEL